MDNISMTFMPTIYGTDRQESRQDDKHLLAYGIVMFLILSLGAIGNILTILVLARREHRAKKIVPYIINLAVLDLLIIVFGYPVAIAANFLGHRLSSQNARCHWSAFINGAVGISSIITLSTISIITWRTITQVNTHRRTTSLKRTAGVILGIWMYGVLAMVPPLFGFSRFVPGKARISCGPDWGNQTNTDLAYNVWLVVVGFGIPVSIISFCYVTIFRYLRNQPVPKSYTSLYYRRRRANIRVACMVFASVLAFLISWSPYCIVSFMSMAHSGPSESVGIASEIAELMAKASVIYNPFVYTAMDKDFRCSMRRLLMCIVCLKEERVPQTHGTFNEWIVAANCVPGRMDEPLAVVAFPRASDASCVALFERKKPQDRQIQQITSTDSRENESTTFRNNNIY